MWGLVKKIPFEIQVFHCIKTSRGINTYVKYCIIIFKEMTVEWYGIVLQIEKKISVIDMMCGNALLEISYISFAMLKGFRNWVYVLFLIQSWDFHPHLLLFLIKTSNFWQRDHAATLETYPMDTLVMKGKRTLGKKFMLNAIRGKICPN